MFPTAFSFSGKFTTTILKQKSLKNLNY